MDPTATLEQIRETIEEADSLLCLTDQGQIDVQAQAIRLLESLTEQVKSLDQWMSRGGFGPRYWA